MASVQQVYLQSIYATRKNNGTYNSDMIFFFTTPIVPPPNHDITLKVKNFYLPISFTVVNDTNNTFTLNSIDYTIENGNYTATQLATTLMNLVAGEVPSFTVEFSIITNKFTFSAVEDFIISGTCDYLLGLDGETSSSSSELISTYPIDLTGDNLVFVDIPNLSTQNLVSSTGTGSSIVGSVLVNVPYGSVLFHEDLTSNYFTIQQDHISFIHVRLLGEDCNTLLDLNNFDWSLTLEIGFIEKRPLPTLTNTFKDIYENYIRSLLNEKSSK